MDEAHGVAQALEFTADQVAAADRCKVPGKQQIGLERRDPLHRVDERERETVAIAAQSDQIRKVSEEGAEHIADEGDPGTGEPDAHGVDGLAARRRDQFEADTAEIEGVPVDEGPRRGGSSLYVQVLLRAVDRTRKEGCRVRDTERVDARVVGLAEGIVRLRDDLGARLAKQVDPADVIDVRLGE